IAAVSDLDASNLAWFKPANARTKVYPAGWPSGISVDLVGSVFGGSPLLPGVPAINPAGNVNITLSDGGLGSSILKIANLSSRNRVSIVDRDDDRLRLNINSRTGAFTGAFTNPLTRHSVKIQGAIIQGQELGTGFFLNEGESGSVTFAPIVP